MKRGIFLIALLMIVSVNADPAVTSVNGNIEHGETITVTGNQFGTKSPAAPLWWDDMEGATDNELVNEVNEMPWVVSGSLTGTQLRYSEAKPRRGLEDEPMLRYRSDGYRNIESAHSYSSRFTGGAHYQHEGNDPQYSNDYYQNVVLTIDSGTADKNQWFVRWYYRVDPEWEVINNYANHKLTAPNFGTTIYDRPNCYSSHGQQSTPGKSDNHDVILSVGNCVGACGDMIEYPGPNPRLTWVAHEQFWDSPAAFHEIWKYGGPDTNSGLATELGGDTSACENRKDNTRSFSIGGWFATNTALVEEDKRGGQENYRYFDDIYVDNTFSRVVLADNEDYSLATIVEPQIPSAWSSDTITADVNLGALTEDTVYLFVFDSDNNHNAVGHPLELGSQGEPDQTFYENNFDNGDDWTGDYCWTVNGATCTHQSTSGWQGGYAKLTPPTQTYSGEVNGGYSVLGRFNIPDTDKLNIRFLLKVGPTFYSTARNAGGGFGDKFIDVHANSGARSGILSLAPWDQGSGPEYFTFALWQMPSTVNFFHDNVPTYNPVNVNNTLQFMGTGSHADQWISVEYEIDRTADSQTVYVHTADGELTGTYIEIENNIDEPMNYIDIGAYFNSFHESDPDTYLAFDELIIDDEYIGPPDGFLGTNCIHTADNNPCDGTLSPSEFMDYILDWISGDASIQNILEVMIIWKSQ